MSQLDRLTAILTVAAPDRKLLDVDDLAALSELADEQPRSVTLAELLLSRARIAIRVCACGEPATFRCCCTDRCERCYHLHEGVHE